LFESLGHNSISLLKTMKTHSLISFLSIGLSFSTVLLGQSSFQLSNYGPPYGIDAPVFDSLGVPLAGTGYLVELWGGATSNSLAPLLKISQGAGREIIPFGDGGYFFSTSSFLSVPTVPPFGWAWLQVRAWDARLGTTYEEVSAIGIGGYGESLLFYAKGNDPTAALPMPGAPLIGLQSFSLLPVVPEPSEVLLLLSGMVLWWGVRQHQPRKS
jgi:hypothetical protein